MNEAEKAELVEHCGHEILKMIGYQENYYQEPLPMGNCVRCHTTKMVSSQYKPLYTHEGDEFFMLRDVINHRTNGLVEIIERQQTKNSGWIDDFKKY